MTQVLKMKYRSWGRRAIALGSTIGVLMMISPAGMADYVPIGPRTPIRGDNIPGGPRAYTPPPDSQRPRTDNTGGGVRGCGDQVAALAPRLSAVGQTTSSHPTFTWHSSSTGAEQLEFHLYKYNADNSLEEVFIRPIGENQPGYGAYTLPASDAGLILGETYLWQVVMYCDQALQEVGKWTSAEIEVVAPPAGLAPVDGAATALQKARAYGQAGLWYDAMAQVYGATTPEEKAFRRDLLLNLADLEAQATQEKAESLSNQLRQIAEMP